MGRLATNPHSVEDGSVEVEVILNLQVVGFKLGSRSSRTFLPSVSLSGFELCPYSTAFENFFLLLLILYLIVDLSLSSEIDFLSPTLREPFSSLSFLLG